MAALVLADAALAQLARLGAAPLPHNLFGQPGMEGDEMGGESVEQLRQRLERETRLREEYQFRTQQLALQKRQGDGWEKVAGFVVVGCCLGLGLARLARR
jgi:hypothetical protein